jgi:hypothetical protein
MDYDMVIGAWAATTYGQSVTRGDLSGVVPRLPRRDGTAPPAPNSG